jgi:hypothetical protein
MTKLNAEKHDRDAKQQRTPRQPEHTDKLDWETPKMEDVSEQVMAQPYIRFT